MWPVSVRLPNAIGRPMLVLFAHSRCACTSSAAGPLFSEMDDPEMDELVVKFAQNLKQHATALEGEPRAQKVAELVDLCRRAAPNSAKAARGARR